MTFDLTAECSGIDLPYAMHSKPCPRHDPKDEK